MLGTCPGVDTSTRSCSILNIMASRFLILPYSRSSSLEVTLPAGVSVSDGDISGCSALYHLQLPCGFLCVYRAFSSNLGKRPLAKIGEKMIDLTSKLREINDIEQTKGSKIYPQNQVIFIVSHK